MQEEFEDGGIASPKNNFDMMVTSGDDDAREVEVIGGWWMVGE